jgi:hypothetical protein
MDLLTSTFETAIPHLRQAILHGFSLHESQAGFRSIWEHFEEVINPILIEFLSNPPLEIPLKDIIKARSKSIYPDLKINYQGKLYAIDIKSGEDGRNPWYDMGRVDTFEKSHLNVYEAEYYITVRWTGRNPSRVINVYIEPSHQSVGYKDTYKGILYRPYDGKIRPKSWADFDQGRIYWKTKADFLQGLQKAKIHRRMFFMVEWYAEMTAPQQERIKQAFSSIERGEQMPLFDTNED